MDGRGRCHGGTGAPARGGARRVPPADVDPARLESAALSTPARPRGAGELRNREALGRSRGGLTSKIHLLADSGCRPLARVTSAGQRHNSVAFLPLMGQLKVTRRGPGRPSTRPGRGPPTWPRSGSGSAIPARELRGHARERSPAAHEMGLITNLARPPPKAPGEPMRNPRSRGPQRRPGQADPHRNRGSSGPAPHGNRPILDRPDSSGSRGAQQPRSHRYLPSSSAPRPTRRGKRTPPREGSSATALTCPRTPRATGGSSRPAGCVNARCIHLWAARRPRTQSRGCLARSPGHRCRKRQPQDRHRIVRREQGAPRVHPVVPGRGIGRVQSQEHRTVGHTPRLIACPWAVPDRQLAPSPVP